MNAKFLKMNKQYVDTIMKYSDKYYGNDKTSKIRRSYVNGMLLAGAFVLLIMVVIVLFIVVSVNRSPMMIGSVNPDYTISGYVQGSPRQADLSDYKKELSVGEKYVVYFDSDNNVANVITMEKYQENQRQQGMIAVAGIAGSIVIGFALFIGLHGKVVSREWIDFVKSYQSTMTTIQTMGECIRIKSGNDHVVFMFENEYTTKVKGKLMPDGSYVISDDGFDHWKFPHDDDPLNSCVIEAVKTSVMKAVNEDTVQIVFD